MTDAKIAEGRVLDRPDSLRTPPLRGSTDTLATHIATPSRKPRSGADTRSAMRALLRAFRKQTQELSLLRQEIAQVRGMLERPPAWDRDGVPEGLT